MIEECDVEDLGVQGEEIIGPSNQRLKRKRGGKDNKKGNAGHRMCDQFERIIESLNSENTITSEKKNVPILANCLDMLKQLLGLEYGSETHILGIRLMKSKANRETFVLLNDHVLQLNWINSHTLVDVSRH
ncbi:hypothetical protein SESBI_07477 [Sesbania bispinosa]|nr:hypothetical protein SESBI_07477 [Sesbania bispinosa]